MASGPLLKDSGLVLEFWKGFDLDEKRVSLERQCVEMREAKATSIKGRNRLIEATKSFRGKEAEEQVTIVNDIIIMYQEEIDQLSRRCKKSEASFIGLYRALYDAPDPVEVIESLMSSVTGSTSHMIEIDKLKKELAHYENEFQKLRNQDITIRRLEEELLHYKDDVEEKVQAEVSRRVDAAEEAAAARVNEARAQQASNERRLSAALESMRQAQASVDRSQAQLFEASAASERRTSGLLQDNATLADDLRAAQGYSAKLEREVAGLKRKLEGAGGSTDTKPAAQAESVTDASNESTLRAVVSDLQFRLREEEDGRRAERRDAEASIRESASTLAKERESLSKCEEALAARPTVEDYTTLRRQLRVLQRVAFNAGGNEDGTDEDDSIPESTLGQVETMLANRVKTLESELVEARASLMTHKNEIAANRGTLATLERSVERYKTLNQRLESDLERQVEMGERSMQLGIGTARIGRARIHDEPTTLQHTHEVLSKNPDSSGLDLTALLSAGSTSSSPRKVTPASTSNNAPQTSSLLEVVIGQRDRYRDKLAAVESSLMNCEQSLEHTETARSHLEKDNLQLYAKIRYLQNGVRDSSRLGNVGQASPQPGLRIRSSGDEESAFLEPEQRYAQLYENTISPFAQFNTDERSRKMSELNVADRIVYISANQLISSKSGRSALVTYLVSIHLLVFAILYWETHRVHHGCDPALDHVHR